MTGYGRLSGSTLKMIGLVTMLIDHVGASLLYRLIMNGYFEPEQVEFWKTCYHWCRVIGRTAFPVFAFLLVEGFLHTSNVRRYVARLLTLAVISEVIYDFALSAKDMPDWFQTQNIFFTLALGVTAMAVLQRIMQYEWTYGVLKWGCGIIAAILFCMVGEYLHFDYGFNGILVILIFYFLYHERGMSALFGYAAMALTNANSLPGFLAVNLYNGKRGWKLKYFFYFFYPAHLLFLYIVSRVLLEK